MKNTLLQKYYKKVAIQGFFKSLMVGGVIALFSYTVAGFVCWLVGYKGLGLCLGILFGVLAVATAIIYFAKYRPDEKDIARRLDACGLEERMVTMQELAGNDSYIARRQREDATNVLNAFNASLLTFTVGLALIITLSISGVLGVGTSTVLGLMEANVIETPGIDIVVPTPGPEEKKKYEVTYDIYGGEGYIDGDIFQIVEEGDACTPISAEADDGYVFVCWIVNGEQTENDNPYRCDVNITEDMTILAYFQEASGQGDGEGDGQGQGEGEGEPSDAPGDGEGDGQGQGDQPGDNPGGKEGGGKHEENNQVIDGETYYGDQTYDNYYKDAVDNMSGSDVSDGDRKIGSDYFDTIK